MEAPPRFSRALFQINLVSLSESMFSVLLLLLPNHQKLLVENNIHSIILISPLKLKADSYRKLSFHL